MIYRPYKNITELVEDYCNRFKVEDSLIGYPNIWIKSKDSTDTDKFEYLITSFEASEFVGIRLDTYRLDKLFDEFTYLDGSPCGLPIKG